jgi:polyisoprenoid-binding protein YceI
MATTQWALDPTHSEIQFKVKHMMISTVSGEFTKFDASLQTEGDDITTGSVQFSADIDSINTKNEQRDGHLKSPDFFDAAQFPQLSFTSTAIRAKSGGDYVLEGNLTLRGVTKPVSLDVVYEGSIKDPFGHTRAGFEINGKINRRDFGLTWSAVTEAGGLVVSDEVRLIANVEFVAQ